MATEIRRQIRPQADFGTNDSTNTNQLIQSGQNFLSTVVVGMVVKNTTDSTRALVTEVNSNTTLTLDADIFTATGKNFTVGGDYTSIGDWVTANGGATGKDLVLNDENVVCEIHNGDYSAHSGGDGWLQGFFNLTGYTTDATRFIRIECPDASMHTGTPSSGVEVRNNSEFNQNFNITGANYTEVYGVDMTYTGVTIAYRQTASIASTNCLFERCIIRWTSAVSAGYPVGIAAANTTLRNCIIIGDATNANACIDITNVSGIVIESCTLVDAAGEGIENGTSGANTVRVRNTVAYNTTVFYQTDFGGTWESLCGYNASSTYTTQAPPDEVGSSNYTSNVVAGDFVAPGSNNYHLSNTSGLIGKGVDISGTFTEDIDGDTRVAWDIGADENITEDNPLVLYTVPGLSVTNP